ncbi:MAG: rRNA maturation RNase YbeY, partial [Longimicrobiales bacterium]|nr:rRNA maturation RNase YbeY [Longimicrobiales bacterium]
GVASGEAGRGEPGSGEPGSGSPDGWKRLRELIRRAVIRTLDAEGAPDAEVSVTLLDDAEIQAMNRAYLAKDATTDVIAFSLGEEAAEVLGDVYIGYDQAHRQARELDVDLEEELARLAIHGTLHVLGHDHPEDEDRAGSAMYRLQERLLAEVTGRR